MDVRANKAGAPVLLLKESNMPGKAIEVLSWSWGVVNTGTSLGFDGEIAFSDGLTFDFSNSPTPALGLAIFMPLEGGSDTIPTEQISFTYTKVERTDGHVVVELTASDGSGNSTVPSPSTTVVLEDPTMHDLQLAAAQLLTGDTIL